MYYLKSKFVNFINIQINKYSLTWFKSYLTNRKQTVKINGINGNMYEIKYGVPQGSVLGPILFILYVNEICDSNIEGSIYLFAFLT